MKQPEKDEKYIPPGSYCYHFIGDAGEGAKWILNCPFRELREDKPQQENGFCHFLDSGDWQSPGIGLIWEGCKECGVNQDEDSWYEEFGGNEQTYYNQIIPWAELIIPLIEDKEHKEVAEAWLQKLKREKDELA